MRVPSLRTLLSVIRVQKESAKLPLKIKTVCEERLHMSNTINRENSLLSTFLYADDVGLNKDNAFKLNSNVFTSEFRRAVANKINDETDNEKMYGFLSVTLKDHTSGSKFEQDWIDIEAQIPYDINAAKRMHNTLESEYKERLAKAFR